MKIDSNNQTHVSSKSSHSFILFGPLIATILTILYAHLIGFLYTDHFGQNIHFRNILAMVASFIPITIGAYIIGFIPAWITDKFFKDLISYKIFLNRKTMTRIIIIGGLAGTPWSIILGSIIAFSTQAHTWWGFFAIGAVTVPTSIICSIIEYRINQDLIK